MLPGDVAVRFHRPGTEDEVPRLSDDDIPLALTSGGHTRKARSEPAPAALIPDLLAQAFSTPCGRARRFAAPSNLLPDEHQMSPRNGMCGQARVWVAQRP